MGRAVPALRPPTPESAARVPDARIDHAVFRAQWQTRDPWWFSSRTDGPAAGRFDLRAPNGTCYFADDPIAALIEKLADPQQTHPLVAREDLDRFNVWSGQLGEPWNTLADTTHRASRIPKELGTVVPYDLAWAWADALHADGRSGLRYWLRLDPGSGRGLALFSDAGIPTDRPALTAEPASTYTEALQASFDLLEPTISFDELLGAEDS